MYTAPPRAATHSPSSGKYTMAAEPPTASWALATKFWVTVLVMEGASGFVSRTSCTARAMSARSSASVRAVGLVEGSITTIPFRKPECWLRVAPKKALPAGSAPCAW